MSQTLNFVAIPDAHTQEGNMKFLPAIVTQVNALRPRPDFVISLGDAIYGLRHNDVVADVRNHRTVIDGFAVPHYYALGNHELEPIEDFGNLGWEDVATHWGLTERWYRFDCRGFRCYVLDSWLSLQEPRHAAVLAAQCEWLAEELAGAAGPVVILTHEALGFGQEDCRHWVETDNRNFWPEDNPLVELICRHAEKVVGVFEGHKHKSLHKHWRGVTWHLLAASFQHGGHFAQAFVTADGRWFVQGHPERHEQNEECTLQQTYGERAAREEYERRGACEAP